MLYCIGVNERENTLMTHLNQDTTSTSRNFYTSIQKTSRCAVTTGILYDSFNACTILLTLSM